MNEIVDPMTERFERWTRIGSQLLQQALLMGVEDAIAGKTMIERDKLAERLSGQIEEFKHQGLNPYRFGYKQKLRQAYGSGYDFMKQARENGDPFQ